MTIPDHDIVGIVGAATRIPRANYNDNPTTLDAWIITAPIWHPLWSQYLLAVVTLADVPHVPPAVKTDPNATHQLMVMTLNPEHGPYDARTVTDSQLHYLQPGNIGEQFTASSDDQAVNLAELCVRAVTDGLLIPETADAPDKIRATWRHSLQQTLNHHRDPHHGRLN